MKKVKKKYTVIFQPLGLSAEVDEGETILSAAQKIRIHINASCGGASVCGKCKVTVKQGRVVGGVSEKISDAEIRAGVRQACDAVIQEDLIVSLPKQYSLESTYLVGSSDSKHRAAPVDFDVETLKREGLFIPPVEKFFLELPRPSSIDNQADGGRLARALSEQYGERGVHIGLSVLRKLRSVCREDDFRVTVTLSRPVGPRTKNQLVNIQSGNWKDRNFGLAVDIGTTTVYCQLLDMRSGHVLAEAGEYNRQISYGEDVIARVVQAEKPKGLELMHDLVVSTINDCIDTVLERSDVNRDEVTAITLAGNTVMTHLLLGLEPHNLRRSPYVPVSTLYPPIRADDLGLRLSDSAIALVFPAVSSYVGGDIVAGIMGSSMHRTEKLTLFIDVGTNAEIVIGNKDWLACAACSAGPAFEGGGITHGMRAVAGAIEDFSLHPVTLAPMNTTIGGKPPKGICGSGLLVIIATLLENGVIDQRGKFNQGIDNERIRQGKNGYEFVLVASDETDVDYDIVLNEVDIDNFIRAKGAIYAGIQTLLSQVGLRAEDLEQIILAGGFGSFLDLDAAFTVGLLPEISPDKVLYVGNGSLLGCRMSGLSNHIRQEVRDVIVRTTSFELSEVAGFQDQFTASLFLPHTDMSLFPNIRATLLEKSNEISRNL